MRTAIYPLLLALIGCAANAGPMPGMDSDKRTEVVEVQRPVLDRLAPTRIALGDTVKVFGDHFLPAKHGDMKLVLEGTYSDRHNNTKPYRGEFPLEVKNPSLAQFDMDKLYFDPNQLRIGTFQGEARVVSKLKVDATDHHSGEELASSNTDVSFRVEPSIAVTHLRAAKNDDCPKVQDATNEGTALSLGVRALGLGKGTEENPIKFHISFQSPKIKANYVKKDVYPSWPLPWGELPLGMEDSVYAEAPKGNNTMSFQVTDGSRLLLDPTWKQTVTRVSPGVRIGQKKHNEVILGRLAAGSLKEGERPPKTASFIVEAVHNGRTIRRLVPLKVWTTHEILSYEGDQRLVKRFPPEVPSGACGSCVPGGKIGRDVKYTESRSKSKSRSVGVRWDINRANDLGGEAQYGPFILAARGNTTLSSTFGVDVNTEVSSSVHKGFDLNARVIPGYYALCYRQLSKYKRTVDVAYHNECGASGTVAQIEMVDWGWGFDVATGDKCPPDPHLPSAKTYEQ